MFTKSHSSRQTTSPKFWGLKVFRKSYTFWSHRDNVFTNLLLQFFLFKIPAVNNDCYIVRFMIYPDLNLAMNSIRILNNNEISFCFRLIYFMTYNVQFPRINTFVTWRWPRAGAETCHQFRTKTSKKLSCVLTHLKPSPYCITKHNGDDASKKRYCSSTATMLTRTRLNTDVIRTLTLLFSM